MRLFIETLMVLLKEEGITQTELVLRCNKNGKKDGLQISKGAISNYKQGRFPEPSYAALIIRNVSKDPVRRNELGIAYLRDVAGELGIEQSEVDIVNLRTQSVDALKALPAHLRAQLTILGQASVKINEYRTVVDKLSGLAKRHISPPPPPPRPRGIKRRRATTAKASAKTAAKTTAKKETKQRK
jgi:hypothetical protein